MIRMADDEYRELFGRKVYKLTLRLSDRTTCPNRDGTLGRDGCAFCTGSAEFAEPYAPLSAQLEAAAKRVRSKLPGNLEECRYIAYFQDHTNTYVPYRVLESRLTEAASHPLVCGLAVGTRPDCVPERVLQLLSRLAQTMPVWVELGLQTAHVKTAEEIGRGYANAVYEETAARLRANGIRVVTHLILGLPGETTGMMTESVRYVNGRTDGVKLHMLHILKGTAYERLYRQGLLSAYSLPEYVRDLSACVRSLAPGITVHRLTGDGRKSELVAPLWSGNKRHVLNAILRSFRSENLIQGSDL